MFVIRSIITIAKWLPLPKSALMVPYITNFAFLPQFIASVGFSIHLRSVLVATKLFHLEFRREVRQLIFQILELDSNLINNVVLRL